MAGQASGRLGRLWRLIPMLVLSVAVACAPIYRNHGYVPAEDELALLTVGKDTRDSVEIAVGRPSAAGLLNEEGWYYVQSRYRQVGPRDERHTRLTTGHAENATAARCVCNGQGNVVNVRAISQKGVRAARVAYGLLGQPMHARDHGRRLRCHIEKAGVDDAAHACAGCRRNRLKLVGICH